MRVVRPSHRGYASERDKTRSSDSPGRPRVEVVVLRILNLRPVSQVSRSLGWDGKKGWLSDQKRRWVDYAHEAKGVSREQWSAF